MRPHSRIEVQRLAAKKRLTLLVLFVVMCGSAIATRV